MSFNAAGLLLRVNELQFPRSLQDQGLRLHAHGKWRPSCVKNEGVFSPKRILRINSLTYRQNATTNKSVHTACGVLQQGVRSPEPVAPYRSLRVLSVPA